MIDIKLIRENRELVKNNIKKKFQDSKIHIVDKVYELDERIRNCQECPLKYYKFGCNKEVCIQD